MDVLSSTSQNAWQEWDAAHTRQPPKASGPILPVKNQCDVDVFPLNLDVLSPTSQNAWQEWDAEHTPRERAKCRSRLGAAHVFVIGSCAPDKVRRTFFARQFVTTRATGRHVALASAPRTCLLEVALPLRRADSSGLTHRFPPHGAGMAPSGSQKGPPVPSLPLLGLQ